MTFVLWVGVGEYVWSFKWESTKHKFALLVMEEKGTIWEVCGQGGWACGVNKVLKETLYQ